jgi:hypothetical protein
MSLDKSNEIILFYIIVLAKVNSQKFDYFQEGSIPVLICFVDCDVAVDALPFSEYLDYSKVVVSTSVARITELHFLLRSIPDSDLHYMQRQGNSQKSYEIIRSVTNQPIVSISFKFLQNFFASRLEQPNKKGGKHLFGIQNKHFAMF